MKEKAIEVLRQTAQELLEAGDTRRAWNVGMAAAALELESKKENV